MPGPPPPPPAPMGPPPPPVMSGMSPAKKSAAPDMRGALLGQIQKGTKLKKVTTVDKSAPAVAGRIAGDSSTSSSPMKSSRGPTSLSNKSSPDSSSSSPVSSASSRPPGGFASLTDELAFKLTMKKNKQSPVKETPTTKESSPPASSQSNNSFVNEIKAKTQPPAVPQLPQRSPPIAMSPSDNHFNTINRNASSNHSKIQETLNLQLSAQKASTQRPTNRPPPPPVPNRNIATNLTSQSHAKSTTALNNAPTIDQSLSVPRRIHNSGSSNNINTSDAIDSPPAPPHRTSSKLPSTPPVSNSLKMPSLNNNQSIPPEVPKRHPSMRSSMENGGLNINQNNRFPSSPNPNQPITRLVVDLEARYSLLFHSLSEFPPPKQFMNIAKTYPSQAVRPTNGV